MEKRESSNSDHFLNRSLHNSLQKRNEFKSNTFNFMLHHKLSFVALAQNNIQSFKISLVFYLFSHAFSATKRQTKLGDSNAFVKEREREREKSNEHDARFHVRQRERVINGERRGLDIGAKARVISSFLCYVHGVPDLHSSHISLFLTLLVYI